MFFKMLIFFHHSFTGPRLQWGKWCVWRYAESGGYWKKNLNKCALNNTVWLVFLLANNLQTNLQFNNNKYYLIQLLQDDSAKVYSVWLRWGRGMRNFHFRILKWSGFWSLSSYMLFASSVGKVGQSSLVSCGGNLAQAKDTFKKK